MKYNDLLPPGDNGRLNEKTCIKCSLKMSYKCMILTASIMFSAFSGSLIYIWVSKDLSAILTERSHMLYESIHIKHPESILVVIRGCRGEKMGDAGFVGY